MQSFTVPLPPGGKAEDAVFVADRWSWPAFIAGPFWLAYHRLWISAALAFVLAVGVTSLGVGLGLHPLAASMLNTLLNVAIALEGPSLRRWKLARNNQPVLTVVAARNEEEAETRFFTLYPALRPAAPAPAPAKTSVHGVAPAGVIGLFPQPGGRL